MSARQIVFDERGQARNSISTPNSSALLRSKVFEQPIDVATISDQNDDHNQPVIVDLIGHLKVTCADTIEVRMA